MNNYEKIEKVIDEMVDDIYDDLLSYGIRNTEINMTFKFKNSKWETIFNDKLYGNLTNDDLKNIETFVKSLNTNNVSLIDVNDNEKYLSFLVDEPYLN